MSDTHSSKYIQKLIRLLVLSGCLNVGMVAFLYWWTVKEAPPIPVCASKPAAKALVLSPSKQRVFSELSAFSKEELFAALYDKALVEDGYRRRDLALSLLVHDHDIDIDRALAGVNWRGERRKCQVGEKDCYLFPSLQDRHYEVLLSFLEREKWPLTPKGLFLTMKAGGLSDVSLKDAFFLTSEFFFVKELFQRSPSNFSDQEILELLLEGDWEPLCAFSEKQKITKDLSAAVRRSLLFSYIKSPKGARFLFRTDPEFIAKQLSDETVLALFYLVREEKDPSIEDVAKKILDSPRGSALWQAAKIRLGKQEVLSDEEMLLSVHKKSVKLEENIGRQKYIVRSGDSLWKIARRFNTTVSHLMKINDLQTERIRPGKELLVEMGQASVAAKS